MMAEDIERAREKILEATLRHVPFDGWSGVALRRGAKEAGCAPDILGRAFPGGSLELIEYFSARANAAMLGDLKRHDLAAMRVRDRISLAVRLRLEWLEPHREAVRRGLAFLALPRNAALALKSLHRTVDAIWYAAGDTATDYNYYTKRGLLAGVYAATVLYWLDDESPGHGATWDFLDRRIADVLKIPRGIAQLSERLPSPDAIFRGLRNTGPRRHRRA